MGWVRQGQAVHSGAGEQTSKWIVTQKIIHQPRCQLAVATGSPSAYNPFNGWQREATPMSKVIYCSKVDPNSDCDRVIRGTDEEEVLRKAAIHAREHGLEPTPDLLERVRAAIEED